MIDYKNSKVRDEELTSVVIQSVVFILFVAFSIAVYFLMCVQG